MVGGAEGERERGERSDGETGKRRWVKEKSERRDKRRRGSECVGERV